MKITQKLADALRAVIGFAESRAEDIEEETGDRQAAKAVDDARAVLATYDQMRGYQSQAVSLLRAQRDRLQTQLREVNSALDDLECGAAVVKTSDEGQL